MKQEDRQNRMKLRSDNVSSTDTETLQNLCSRDPSLRLGALNELASNPDEIKNWSSELWGLTRGGLTPIRYRAIELLSHAANSDPEVLQQVIERLASQSPEQKVAAVRVLARIPHQVNESTRDKLIRLAESGGQFTRAQSELLSVAFDILEIPFIPFTPVDSLHKELAERRAVGKALDTALFFRPTDGPAHERGLLLWVMCSTVGLEGKVLRTHFQSAVANVLAAIGSEQIEFVGRGGIGFRIDEDYFERGMTWKEVVIEPKALRRAYKEAYGAPLSKAEKESRLIQIGTFPENGTDFYAIAGPMRNSRQVDIERLLRKGHLKT